MDKRIILNYLKKVNKLELLIYELKTIENHLSKQKDVIRNSGYIAPVTFEYKSNISRDASGTIIGSIIVGAIAFPIICLIFSPILSKFFNFSIFEAIGIGIGIGFVLGILFIILDFSSEEKAKAKVEKENGRIVVKNNNIKQKKSCQISLIDDELQQIAMVKKETEQILNKYYLTGIIYPKYRSLIPISSFLEYFDSGRCSSFEGHEGAYNIYESERRQNIIIEKLDVVINKLDQIIDNQYYLYTEITKCNSQIEKICNFSEKMTYELKTISDYAEVASYYSQISAYNSRCLLELNEL